MIVRKLRLLHRNQRGLTLLELMVALTISCIIGLGATVANFQVLNQTSNNNNHTTASRHAMNAIYWISCDTQMAQTIAVDGGTSGFPLALIWVDWDNSVYTANYTLADGKLTRTLTVDSGDPRNLLVAEYINTTTNMTYCSTYNGTLTLSITSSVGEGMSLVNVTREREIASRPNL